jgi:3-hydroxybutyrate dehydrogenase
MLAGRVALITGSTSGIGLAIARRFAAEGATVVLHGLAGPGEGQSLAEAIGAASKGSALFEEADLRDPDQIDTMISRLLDRFGVIDILVNNAGIQHVSPVSEFPRKVWDEMLAVNLSAAFHTIRGTLPAMVARDWGRIINIASISGLRGRANKSGYNVTKHGLIGLTRSVGLEVAATGVTCNAICPGWVHTPLVERQVEALAQREGLDIATATARLLGARQPSGRFVTAGQVAGLCMFLCSSDADEVRGAAWPIDGATTAA